MSACDFAVQGSWERDRPGVVYRKSEYSVASLSKAESEGVALINEVSIMVNATDEIVGLSGYFPYTEWVGRSLRIPPSERQIVKLSDDDFATSGIPVRLNDERWPVWQDPAERIVCLGCPDACVGTSIEAVEGVHLCFDAEGDGLVAIFMSDLLDDA